MKLKFVSLIVFFLILLSCFALAEVQISNCIDYHNGIFDDLNIQLNVEAFGDDISQVGIDVRSYNSDINDNTLDVYDKYCDNYDCSCSSGINCDCDNEICIETFELYNSYSNMARCGNEMMINFIPFYVDNGDKIYGDACEIMFVRENSDSVFELYESNVVGGANNYPNSNNNYNYFIVENETFYLNIFVSDEDLLSNLLLNLYESNEQIINERIECSQSMHCQYGFSEFLDVGVYNLQITSIDLCQKHVYEYVNITVSAINDPPEIKSVICENCDNAKSGDELFFTVSLSDDAFVPGTNFEFLCDNYNLHMDLGDNLILNPSTFQSYSENSNDVGCLYRFSFTENRVGDLNYKIRFVDFDLYSNLYEYDLTIQEKESNILNSTNNEIYTTNTNQSNNYIEYYFESNEIHVGNPVKIIMDAYNSNGIKRLAIINNTNIFQSNKLCNNLNNCDYSVEFIPEQAGTYFFKGYIVTSNNEKIDSYVLELNVLCSPNNPCCNIDSLNQNIYPRESDNGCVDYRYFICDNYRKIRKGHDSDGDGYDLECGDCDDENRFIFPDNENSYCGCSNENLDNSTESIFYQKKMYDEICYDGYDNDCDGKIDCYDVDCSLNGLLDAQSCNLNCTNGFLACNGNCVDLNNDDLNCGECGKKCLSEPNSISKCNLGRCVRKCIDGFSNCLQNEIGCETNIRNDNNNCGSCGTACLDNEICKNSVCVKKEYLINIFDNDNNSDLLHPECFEDSRKKCKTENGCNGFMTCENGLFSGVCECEPFIKILSPSDDDVLESNRVKIEIDTNVDLKYCSYRINSINSETFMKKEFNKKLNYGNNRLYVKCLDASDFIDFRIVNNNAPKDFNFDDTYIKSDVYDDSVKLNMTDVEIEDILVEAVIIDSDLKINYTESLNNKVKKHNDTSVVVNLDQYYKYEENVTLLVTSVEPDKELKDVEIYIEFPKCAAHLVDDIKFENENYKIVKDDPIVMWHFSEVSDNIDLNYEFDKKLSPECISQINALPIADTIGGNINEFTFSKISPLLLIPIVSIIFVVLSQFSNRKTVNLTEDERIDIQIEKFIQSRKKIGESDDIIRAELKQTGVSDLILDKFFKK